jgi:type I restriction enzyme S subunit
MVKTMNKIEKLIDEFCPEGVEFRALGEVCLSITAGGDLPNNYLKGLYKPTKVFPYPIYSNGTDEKALYGFTDSYKIGSTAVTVSARGTIGYHAMRNARFTPIVRLITLIPDIVLTPQFLNYVLDITEINHSGGSIPQLTVPNIKKIKIPIPPLAVQEEIVKILDNFTKLEAELEAELEARKKQYEHYREALLSFGDLPVRGTQTGEVGFRALGEVCDYVDYRGKTPKKIADGIFLVTAKNIRKGYIDYNTSQEFISENDYNLVMRRGLPEIGDVLITTEAPCGFVAQVDRKNIALAQRVIKYRSKNELLLNSFLKHYLLGNQFQKKLNKTATGATVKGIKGSKLHKLTIPIPPLAEQERIVVILDKFDALVNDISTGLPAEIAARKKQYEYYRNRLLTFKPLEKQDVN